MGAQKNTEYGLISGVKRSLADESPAILKDKALINSKLISLNDKIMTKSVNYKLPEIYDACGDVSKQWFVFYSFLNPETGKFQRFKVFRDINSSKLKGERLEKAKAIKQAMLELLVEGFNPFYEYKPDLDFSFCNCIDTFLNDVKDHLRVKSYKRYYYEFKIMKAWFIDQGLEDLHIKDVTKQNIFEFLEFARIRKKWTSGKTYNTHKANISRLFNYFINNYDDVLVRNPVNRIESKPFFIKGNQPYNNEEFKAIKKAIQENDPYLWRICQFVYYAAVRNESEGIQLKVGDIDWKQKKLVIRPEVSKAKKKQYVPIYPEFMEVLLEMGLDKEPSDYYIFGEGDKPSPEFKPFTSYYFRFRKCRTISGVTIDHGIYAFKHTRACHMVEDGATLYEIQTLFRHETLLMTMEYLKSVGKIIDTREITKSRII